MEISPPCHEEEWLVESGWELLDTSFYLGDSRSFVSGDPQGNRLRIRYFLGREKQSLLAKVWFGPEAEGPPCHAHGGSMAAVLDETMGLAAMIVIGPVLAAQLKVNFRQPLPLGSLVQVETRVEKISQRKIKVWGGIIDTLGLLYAEGEGIFVQVPTARFGGCQEKKLK